MPFSGAGLYTPTYVYNRDPTFLKKYRAQKAKARLGVDYCRVACVGTSISASYGAGVGNAFADARNRGYPAKLGRALIAAGFNVTRDSIWGTANDITNYAAYNTLVTLGAGFVAGANSLGGPAFRNSTNTNALVLTPAAQVDTFDTYTIQDTAYGVSSATIDVGVPTVITQTGSAGFIKTPMTIAKGAHTLSFARVSGIAALIGIDAYDSTNKGIRIFNMGWESTTTGSWADVSKPYAPASALQAIAPDLTIIELGINDWSLGLGAIPQYVIDLQTMITAAKVGGGDVILIADHNISGSTAFPRAYNDAMIALGKTNNAPIVDNMARWIDYATANSLGYMFDGVHPKEVGFEDWSMPIIDLLVNL